MSASRDRYEGALRATHSYVARRPCSCICWAVVDNPADAAYTAREVAAMVKAGYAPERLDTQQVREASWGCAQCRRPRAARQECLEFAL